MFGISIDAENPRIRLPANRAGLLAFGIGGPRADRWGGLPTRRGAIAIGDPLACRVLDELAADLALALSHVVHLLHPEAIVLGGGLSLVGEPLRQAVALALPGYVMQVFHPVLAVRLALAGRRRRFRRVRWNSPGEWLKTNASAGNTRAGLR